MKLINTNKELLKKYMEKDNSILYVSLVPYKNNSCIKVYTEAGEPIGDIPENEICNYINENQIVLFIKEIFNDETGLFDLEIGTIL